MPDRKAEIIPEPAPGTRAVLDQKALPVAVSSGEVNFVCGSCGVVLIQGLVGNDFGNMVIRCPNCGKFNDMMLTKLSVPLSATPAATPIQAAPQRLSIPHHEEPMNPSATLANTNAVAIIMKWLQNWGVPAHYWEYWKTAIDIQVYDVYPASLISIGIKQDTPAGTWEANGKRHLAVKPQWLNPGVIAHEQAHNSYALLGSNQKAAFATFHNSLKNSDPLIRLLYSKNQYGLTTDIEGHAEVYCYIGQQMPEQLKQYYPMLF
jgi:hypothetical protein